MTPSRPVTYHEYAERLVERDWRNDFRYGVVRYTPLRDPDGPPKRKGIRRHQAYEDRIRGVVASVLNGLMSGEIDAQQAREQVAREGLEDKVFISDTKEQLIDDIAGILMRGAGAYDAGMSDGMYFSNFWHDH